MKKLLSVLIFSIISIFCYATLVFAEDEVITLRFQDWRLAEEPAASALASIVTRFEEAHPNIKVELEPVTNSERKEKFNNQVRAGDPPDVVRFNLTEIPTEIAMGAFEPLEQYMQEGIDAFYADFSQYLVKPAIANGHAYAVPHEGDGFVFYVNKAMWEEAGLDPVNNPPKTFDDLAAVNKALTDPKKNQYAFGMYPNFQWLQSWVTAFGGRYFNDDYTEVYMDAPEALKAFDFFINMYLAGQVPPGAPEFEYGDQIALIAQNQVGYIQGPFAAWGNIIAANPEMEKNLITLPFPGTGQTAGRGTEFAIGAGSKHPKEAWMLIEWLTNTENQFDFFVHGSMLPARASALAMINLDEFPYARTMIEKAVPNIAEPYPAFPDWGKYSLDMDNMIIASLLGEGTPEENMRAFAEKVRAGISK